MIDNQKKLKDAFERFELLDKKQIESQLGSVFKIWTDCAIDEDFSDFSLKYLCKITSKFNISEKLYFWLKNLNSEKQLDFISKISNFKEDSSIVLKIIFGLLGFFITDTKNR